MGLSRIRRADYAIDVALRAIVWLGHRLPYPARVRFTGWIARRVIGPLAGWPGRIRANLDHVMPELTETERARLVREVSDNAGRNFAEMYSGEEFAERIARSEVEGPGFPALESAREAGRPAVVVTGHFGNYGAPRAALLARGCRLAGLYRPMRNDYFNEHYVQAMAALGGPVFPTGRQGLGRLLRHLRGGGMVGMVVDVYAKHALELDFLGRPAPTAVSAAELALKYDAPLVPAYGIRKADGLTFRIVAEAPIPPSDPVTMTQALNDSLSRLVMEHPGQWFWVHRRWKPRRGQRARPAAKIAP